MNIAVVHDWLISYGGAEKTLKEILTLFPTADLFSVVDFFSPHTRKHIGGKRAKTTLIQKLPFAKKLYRYYLPLMPFAIEQLDLTGYDLILSSSTAVAKGVIASPDACHICYCNSPMRYAWDLQHQYVGKGRFLTKYLLHRLRLWDALSAKRVDHFMANSHFIARRIEKAYRRNSTVVYPPVDVKRFTFSAHKEDFYLTASRLVPYKRVDLIVDAFGQMPDKKLIVVGQGPEKKRLRKYPNVAVIGYQTFDRLVDLMGRARGFVFAAKEDFGIAPIEAQACGTPVIAYARGGASETVIEGKTGCFFQEQSTESLKRAVANFEENRESLLPESCRARAEEFSVAQFQSNFLNYINSKVKR